MTRHFDQRRPHVVAFTGNTHRPSKSRSLAEALSVRLQEKFSVTTTLLDVFEAGAGLGAAFKRSELTPEAKAVVEAIEQADALIAISPVYKGSYTGLFKHAFDFIDPVSLAGKPVLVGATGAGNRHALVVEHQLRPLFGFFSALTLPTAVYAADEEFRDGIPFEQGLLARIDLAAGQLAGYLAQPGGRSPGEPGARTEASRSA